MEVVPNQCVLDPPADSVPLPQVGDVYLIGSTSLLRKCAIELLEQGFSILGIISSDPDVVNWARQAGIAVHRIDDAAAVLKRGAYDYLFSVVNPVILSSDVIGTATRGAFNYHDSPLPRYAGIHATSWALLNRERVHGISWHRIGAGIDTGDIVSRRAIQIGPRETTFTLNARCYEAALEEFRLLLPRLKGGLLEESGDRQDVRARSYFGRHEKPQGGGLLDLEEPAESIEALVRALDFGTTSNTLAAASLWIGRDQLLVGRAELLDEPSSAPAGTLLASEDDAIIVATATRDLRLGNLRSNAAEGLSVAEMLARCGLGIGSRIPLPSDGFRRSYQEQLQVCSAGERYWVEQLQRVNAFVLPGPGTRAATRGCAIALREQAAAGVDADCSLVAVFLLYLARLLNTYEFTVGVRRPVPSACADWNPFAEVTPLTLRIDRADTWRENAVRMSAAIAADLDRPTYARDVFQRHPELSGTRVPPFAVVIAAAPVDADHQAPISLHVDRSRLMLGWDETRHSGRLGAKLREFPGWLTQLGADAAAKPLWAVPVLSERDHAEQLTEWTDTSRPLAPAPLVHRLFEEQAQKTPDADAVCCGTLRFSYRELNDKAERFSALLRGRGVSLESRVGVCLERSSELLVAFLGILKAGGTYVPLDPDYPAERMDFIVADAGLEAVVTSERHRGRFEAFGVATVVVGAEAYSGGAAPLTVHVRPDNAAYVIYTSGSTGRPKGIAIPHRGAVTTLTWAKDCLGAELRSVLWSTSACFDLSIVELLGPLVAGGRCVVADTLLDWLESDSDVPVTLISSVPSIVREFLQALAKDPTRAPRLREMLANNLMAIGLGGEALSRSLVDACHDAFPNITVRDLYGPSEYSILTTSTARGRGETETIGRPLDNAKIYILDDDFNPVLVGAVGELYVTGPGLARGYIGRPDLTAESFLPNPFGDDRHTRLYRTRDRCRFLDDGRIVYLGRTDNQVKVRGHRIELGEIEHALNSHPDIEGSYVTTFTDRDGQPAIVAYLASSKSLDVGEMRAFLRRKLASYMVPQALVQMKELPLLTSGKVDRRALPAPAVERAASSAFEPAAGEIEIALAELWRQVLEIDDRPGAMDDFFSLGGQSLLAIELLNKVKETFGCRLRMGDFFEAPTIRMLAALVAAATGQADKRQPSIVPASDAEDLEPEVCFMGPSQWPFWFAYHPEQFNVPVYIPIRGAERELVPGIIEALPRAFPLLTYRPRKLTPKIVKRRFDNVPLLDVDLSFSRDAIAQADALRQFMSDCKRDFTAGRTSPQLYAVLARVDEDRSILALRYPHYHGDGDSNHLIERRVMAWLSGKDGDAASPARFMDAIREDQRWASISRIERGKAFWTRLLEGAENTIVPRHWFSRDARKPRLLLDVQVERVERIRQRHGVLLRSLYVAALSHALGALLPARSMIIRHFVARQPERGAASTIYPRLFVEAYPVDLSKGADRDVHIDGIKATTKQVLAAGDVALPLPMAGTLAAWPSKAMRCKAAVAQILGKLYGVLIGADPLQTRLLMESMAGFVREPDQVDVYLNIIPEGPPLTSDPTLQALIGELNGRYVRQCSGHLRETFCLDVFEDGGRHRLSLDSPFSEAIDRRIIGKIEEFLHD